MIYGPDYEPDWRKKERREAIRFYVAGIAAVLVGVPVLVAGVYFLVSWLVDLGRFGT